MAQRFELARAYLELKAHYYEVDSQLPPDYRNPNFRPCSDPSDPCEYDKWRRIRTYWYHAFDEWFVTKHLNPDLFGELWDNYYAAVIDRSLEVQSLRDVFCELCKEGFSKDPGLLFVKDVENSYKERHPGERLCDREYKSGPGTDG
jgi:hypothetical protein